jgi:hypothetical protein
VRFWVAFLLILNNIAFSAVAAPFLVCDPYGIDGLQPTAFEVTVDGRSERIVPLTYPDGSAYLYYDLTSLSDGEHLVRVKAMNDVWHSESAEVSRVIKRQDGLLSLGPVPVPKERMAPSRSYGGHIRR